MKHFFRNIDGWFAREQQLLYKNQVKQANDGYHFVEIGSWKGRSSSYMGVEIINSGKKIKFDTVDHWLGSSEHQNDLSVKNNTLYDEYLLNIKSVNRVVNPIRMKSVDASKLYKDNSLDFVFIDAGHEYEFVKEDIESWLPKVRDYGILAGDDWDNTDWNDGVKKAVSEIIKKPIIDRNVWIYRK